MEAILELARDRPVALVAGSAAAAFVAVLLQLFFQRLVLHPLAVFPGPRLAALTFYYKAFLECIVQRSWHLHLEKLHKKYGPVVRVSPTELHFNDPQAYLDIYNSKNRWDKEESLYHSFGEDRSSFGFLTYKEAKERKDVLNKSFSARAIEQATGLVQDKVEALCNAFNRTAQSGQLADLTYAFRCMTMDIITYYSFGQSVDAVDAAGFRAPIILAMDAAMPVFVRFKHSSAYKNMIIRCPPALSRLISPETAGMVDLQQILGAQLERILADRERELALLPHGSTIYHHLLRPNNFPDGTVPSSGSLYEEGQALMFGGADTVGNTLMVMAFHMARDPTATAKLKTELRAVMSDPAAPPPSLRDLERLPFLNACLKEALRMNSGVISGLPRITPAGGATIAGVKVPSGTVVSIGSTFVHYNEAIFPDPYVFRPERWLDDSKGGELDNWLVAFSRGPRACLGINLAWAELRLAFATVWRRFDIDIDRKLSPDKLEFRETFLPMYLGKHVMARMTPVKS